MYDYIIYEKADGSQNILEYICGAGHRASIETEDIANERLVEIRCSHPNPSSVTMEKKIIVFK